MCVCVCARVCACECDCECVCVCVGGGRKELSSHPQCMVKSPWCPLGLFQGTPCLPRAWAPSWPGLKPRLVWGSGQKRAPLPLGHPCRWAGLPLLTPQAPSQAAGSSPGSSLNRPGGISIPSRLSLLASLPRPAGPSVHTPLHSAKFLKSAQVLLFTSLSLTGCY